MKIAIIVRRLNVKGGTQRQALFLAKELTKQGHTVQLYTFFYNKENCYSELLEEQDVTVVNPISPSRFLKLLSIGYLGFFLNLLYENRTAKKLAFLINRDTEILNPHDQLAYRVAYYFKKHVKNIPSVWMMNDMPTKEFSFAREKECNPAIHRSWIKRVIQSLVDNYDIKKCIKRQDTIMVLDNRDKELVKKYFGMEACVIRSGIDVNEFEYKKREAPSEKKVRILLTGIFFRHRRFEDFIHACMILQEKEYSISASIIGSQGDKMYYKEIQDLIESHSLSDRIRLLDSVSEAELKASYHDHDIFVFPSHLQSWGLAVFEAMASGMPVVVSKSAGASEVLENGENAILADSKSPQGLAEAIMSLMDTPGLYSRLSRNGREFVEKNLSWESYTNNMLEVFEASKP